MNASSVISPGLPVEVGEIERQLGLLWEQADAGKVRASLVNLVIYSEAPGSIGRNTPLLASIAGDHAFRALLVQGHPHAAQSGVHAWITAHCHLREAGKKEICSEQITFQLDGPAARRLPSIVFSHLDSDLPLYLWWQSELPPEPAEQLWTWVDRLIVDSHSWRDLGSQFRRLRELEQLGRRRFAICDLTWTRIFNLRYAIAQIFDLPAARDKLDSLRRIEICHAPGHRITALQLLGWLASRLGWQLDRNADEFVFRLPDQATCHFHLREEDSKEACIASVLMAFEYGEARVHCQSDSEFYLVEFTAPGSSPYSQLLPAGRDKTTDILLSELSRASRHPLYWPTIRAIEPLLGRD